MSLTWTETILKAHYALKQILEKIMSRQLSKRKYFFLKALYLKYLKISLKRVSRYVLLPLCIDPYRQNDYMLSVFRPVLVIEQYIE